MTHRTPHLLRAALAALVCYCSLPVAPAYAADAKKSFDIPAGPALERLKQFTAQSGEQLLYAANAVEPVTTNAVRGELTSRDALDQMVSGTNLVVVADRKNGALTVRRETEAERKNASRLAQKNSDQPSDPRKTEDGVIKLETFEVMGTKSLNMDVKRSRDDSQPYVIFDRAAIERSGAISVDDFLKTRLTMNTQAASQSQSNNLLGGSSAVNLRGLGVTQTLILIDGHRAPSKSLTGTPSQADLNGIPVAAIERIEILPTTASGIYGGAATGGVINVVLRRDYAGMEVKVSYENSFDTDTALRRVDFSAGFNLEGGKTNFLLSGSYADQDSLAVQDRNFLARGRARLLANNPGALLNTSLVTNFAVPLGATPNIRSSNGTNLVLRNGTALNSPITFIPTGYSGTAGDGGAALVANAGTFNLAPAESAQPNGGGRVGQLNGPTLESINATIRRQFTAKLQAFVEFTASNNTSHFPVNGFGIGSGGFTIAATAPNNPFTQAISVMVPNGALDADLKSTIFQRRALGGVIVQLPADWKAEADYTWGEVRIAYVDPTTTANPPALTTAVNTGTLDVLRDIRSFPLDLSPYAFVSQSTTPFYSTLNDAAIRVSGPIGSLPGGAPTLSGLVEHRDEDYSDGYRFTSATSQSYFPSRSQTVDSVYLETQVPLVSARNHHLGLQLLELQAAGRLDDYTVNAVTTSINPLAPVPIVRTKNRDRSLNPTVGFRYSPLSDFVLRASYGTGFLPPAVTQLVPSTNQNFASVSDPRRGGTATGVIPGLSGGNPNLKPEKSESWSTGIIFTPHAVPDFRLSVDYTRIDKTDNINLVPGGPQGILNNESLLPGRVTRGPVPANDPFGVGPVIAIDNTFVNLAKAQVEAYDVAADYSWTSPGLGRFDFFAMATWQTHYRTQLITGAATVDNVGITSSNPLKLKGNAGVTWTRGPWTVGWTGRYFHSYLAAADATTILNQGSGGRVPSQNYHDVFVAYRPSAAHRWFARSEVQVGVKNVFNTSPPYDANAFQLLYSLYGDPRLASYYISIKKNF